MQCAGASQGQAAGAGGLPAGQPEQILGQDEGDGRTVDFKVMLRKGVKARSVQVVSHTKQTA